MLRLLRWLVLVRLRKISGGLCVKILCNEFGFRVVRQRGSHVVLRKNGFGTVVPLHDELKLGTLKGILRLAKVDEFVFASKL